MFFTTPTFIRDRFWLLEILGVLLLLVLAILFPAWLNALPPFEDSGPFIPCLSVFLALVSLILALTLAIASRNALSRNRKRWKALHGNLYDIPESNVTIDTKNVADTSNGDFIVSWRAAHTGQAIGYVCLRICLFLAPVASLVVPSIVSHNPNPFSPMPAYTNLAVQIAEAVVLIVVGLAYLLLYFLLRNRHVTLRATEEGIVRKPLIGRRRMIRWNEARLLEVTVTERNMAYQRSYALYSERRMISWEEAYRPKGTFVQDGISVLDAAERNQQLINMIVARTGLTPRTFSPLLQARASSASTPAPSKPVHDYASRSEGE